MSSPALTATLQAALFSGLSNLLAQAITSYRSGEPFVLDFAPLWQFVLWALISTPPNFYWQMYLEEQFPSNVPDAQGVKRMSKTNAVKKFVLDQALSAPINNAAFIAGLNTLKGRSASQIQGLLRRDFWPIMQSGYKVWPLVSVLSFTVIPARHRILFGSIIGLFWGTYLSLLAAH